ncbi:MAG: hypothetical protein K0U98_05205 [Deltaproteobacteria bacterium]|nr:hypothetical protein [Deltaproteobacteria bacterium]
MVTDIWFRSSSSLEDLAAALHLKDYHYDCENYWEWIIGGLDAAKIDITRTHTMPAAETDTRIFRYEEDRKIEPSLETRIVEALHEHGIDDVISGEWLFTSENDFEKVVSEIHTRT